MGKELVATWKPIIDGKVHTVELRWDKWTSRGEVLVDGEIADDWSVSWRGSGTRKFEVAGKPAIIKNGLIGLAELIIDGQRVKQPPNWLQKQNKVLQIIVVLAGCAAFPLAVWFIFTGDLRYWAIYAGIVFSIVAVVFIIKIIKQP